MDEIELPRVLQQLWGIEGRTRPGPKPAFQVGDIGRAAIKLADAGGLSAVSMSKVAAELGVTTMALYRYVEAKDDLYVVMLDEAFGLPPDVSDAEDWQQRITTWAEAFRAALQEHPWILQVPVFEPPLSPNQLVWMEAGLRAFEDTPLTPSDRLSAMLLVNIYVRGTTGLSVNMLNLPPHEAAAAGERYARRLRMLATPDRFPAITATLEQPQEFIDNDPTEFYFGLTTVLDGVQSLISRRAT
ncbi:TetR/AcrR family transcriptional regulator [Kribbella sp. NPDC026611]|uniref:TetR/AcrR family transcriptional regulator n=1 Tax=Kribbella sp. NPDC026611 TaxID=3154911 RepID=UPI0033D7B73D